MLFKKKKEQPPPEQAPPPAQGPPPGGESGHPAEPMFKEAMNLLNSDQYDEAITAFNNLIQQYPDFEPSMMYYGLGVAYDGQGYNDYSVQMLQQSIQANVQNFEAHIFLGNIYAKIGKHQDAIAEYSFVVENNPQHELAPGLRAQIEELRNFSPEAARAKLVDEVEAFRHLVKQQMKVDLDFTPRSLEVLNMIMDAGFSDVSLAGGYIGEVIVRNLGGQWNVVMPREESTIEGLGMNIQPFDVAAKKVEYGKKLSILAQYNYIQSNMG